MIPQVLETLHCVPVYQVGLKLVRTIFFIRPKLILLDLFLEHFLPLQQLVLPLPYLEFSFLQDSEALGNFLFFLRVGSAVGFTLFLESG